VTVVSLFARLKGAVEYRAVEPIAEIFARVEAAAEHALLAPSAACRGDRGRIMWLPHA
jgi:hypothetical protein